MALWQTTRFRLDLTRPLVMGIVNNTPDSFSDGGHHHSVTAALRHAEKLLKDGPISWTLVVNPPRPAPLVPLEEEMRRVLPFVQAAVQFGVPISVDTYKAQVMQAVLDAGADIINDVWALRQPRAQSVVANHPQCGVVLMHMHKTPQDMQLTPMQGDAVAQVQNFLAQQTQALVALGVVAPAHRVGLRHWLWQNRGAKFCSAGPPGSTDRPRLCPAGRLVAQKLFGPVTNRPVEERMVPSVAAAVLAVERGARIVRVHDVAETVSALAVWQAMHDNE